MVTCSARLPSPGRGRSNWKNPFPIGRRRIPKLEKIFHFWNESNPTRESRFLPNPDQKRKSPVARALSSHRNGFINSADVRHFYCIYLIDKMSRQFWDTKIARTGGNCRAIGTDTLVVEFRETLLHASPPPSTSKSDFFKPVVNRNNKVFVCQFLF